MQGMIPVPDVDGAFVDDDNKHLSEMGIALWALVQRLDVLIALAVEHDS